MVIMPKRMPPMPDLCASCGGWVDEDCDCSAYLESVVETTPWGPIDPDYEQYPEVMG